MGTAVGYGPRGLMGILFESIVPPASKPHDGLLGWFRIKLAGFKHIAILLVSMSTTKRANSLVNMRLSSRTDDIEHVSDLLIGR
jgi:hypothetical protein